MSDDGPYRPEPAPITLRAAETMVGVLDLSTRCDEAGAHCEELVKLAGPFLDRARAANVPIFHTIVELDRETPYGKVSPTLKPRAEEPVIYGNTFDKFANEGVRQLVKGRESLNLVLAGAATTFAVLYTATTAANIYRYQVVIPVDGVAARTPYEQEYALHQMSVLPPRAIQKIQFTRLSDITFTQ